MSTAWKRRLLAAVTAGWFGLLIGSPGTARAAASGGPPPPPPALWTISGHWAAREIRSAYVDFWAQGYPDQSFRPDAEITRAEFLSLLLKANWARYDKGGEQPFTDAAEHWVSQEGVLPFAVRAGLVIPADYPGGRFQPDRPITRLEIAVLAVRALTAFKFGGGEPDVSGDGKLDFRDAPDVPDWAARFVSAAVANRILTGYTDGTFRPARTATRAEAVVIVRRQLEALQRAYLATLPYREGADPDGRRVRVVWATGFPYWPGVKRPLYGDRPEDQPVIGQLLRLIEAAPEASDPDVMPNYPVAVPKPQYTKVEFADGESMIVRDAIRCQTDEGGRRCGPEPGWLTAHERTLRSDALWRFYTEILPRFMRYVPMVAADPVTVRVGETLTVSGEGWLAERVALFVRTEANLGGAPSGYRLGETTTARGAFRWTGTLPAELPDTGGGAPLRLTAGGYVIEVVPIPNTGESADHRLSDRHTAILVR